jgi:hypothetical protein
MLWFKIKKIWDLYLIQGYYYQIEKKRDRIFWKFTWLLLPTAVQVYFTIGVVLYLQKLLVSIGYFSKFHFSNSELKFVLISVPAILTLIYFTFNYLYLFRNNRYLDLLKNHERPKRYFLYFSLSFGSLFFMMSYALCMI